MQETSFTVRILNETLGIGEKIARIGSFEGTSFLRNASLSVTGDKIQLGCIDDVGGSHDLGSLPQQSISRIRFKKSVITPGQQLIKPAMSGVFTGIMLVVIILFKVGERRVTDIGETIGIGIAIVLGMVALFVVINLGKVSWSNLAVIMFESNDGKSIEVAIGNKKADALITLFIERNIPVEPL